MVTYNYVRVYTVDDHFKNEVHCGVRRALT